MNIYVDTTAARRHPRNGERHCPALCYEPDAAILGYAQAQAELGVAVTLLEIPAGWEICRRWTGRGTDAECVAVRPAAAAGVETAT